MVIGKLRCCLSLLTVLPVGGYCSLREAGAVAWLFPVAGLILGAIAGAMGYLLHLFLPWSVAAGIALFFLLLLTGFHHLDGLLDLSDAAMVRGGRRMRQRVMHSPGIGAGALGVGVMVLLVTYLALSHSSSVIKALVVAEASAKASMLLVAYLSPPAWRGMGEEFITSLREHRASMLLGVLVYLVILLPLTGTGSIRVLIAVLVSSFLLARFSQRIIGGVSGDVLGAANEVTRMLALVMLL
jgi:adenosylcobinamide-GDP ribazoletransferase